MEDPTKYRPLNGMVLLQVLDTGQRPDSLIIIPDAASGRPNKGRVLAVSPGQRTTKGALIECPVVLGETVVFNPYAIDRVLEHGSLAQAEGTPYAKAGEHILIAQAQLFAVVDPDPKTTPKRARPL